MFRRFAEVRPAQAVGIEYLACSTGPGDETAAVQVGMKINEEDDDHEECRRQQDKLLLLVVHCY